ncbi:MAG: 50S ribosomal protein L3 [Candidatus Moranbacteria bacterium]|nr:50S ribosomal protein L3 [Candidatus Moranbacteria bacterium]
MSKFILGKKMGMTTLYNETGVAQNMTLAVCSGKVALVRNKERDGYSAVQVEMEKTKNRKVKKEFRVENTELKSGDEVKVENFAIGDIVQVSGTSKAKGFQGVVKRHGFAGAPSSHGRKHDMRKPGSIGSGFPEHVLKGKRMAGRMGGKRATSRNIQIVFIDKEKQVLGLKGPVPGIPGSIIEIYQK